MIGIDTNILIYARVASAPLHAKAVAFLEQCAAEPDVVLAELVLVELYLALRNPAILAPPLDAASAAAECQPPAVPPELGPRGAGGGHGRRVAGCSRCGVRTPPHYRRPARAHAFGPRSGGFRHG